MTNKNLKNLYLNNIKDFERICNILNFTESQREELNKHLDKKAFNLIIISISKRFNIDVPSAKDFLREAFLLLLMKSDDRDNLKIYNCILFYILKICNKSKSLESVKSEILSTGENEIKKYFNKIA